MDALRTPDIVRILDAPSLLMTMLPVIGVFVVWGVFALLFSRRGGKNDERPRIHAVPRGESRMLRAASVMLALSGVLIRVTTELIPRALSRPSLATVILLVVAGALYLLGERRAWLPRLAALVLSSAVYSFYADILGVAALLVLSIALLLILWSSFGWRYNVVWKFLPKRFAVPALNVLSTVLALFVVPIAAVGIEPLILKPDTSPIVSYVYLLVNLLPLASLLLINLASEARPLPARTSPDVSTRSAPGGVLFTAASWLLLAAWVYELMRVMLTVYNVGALALRLPLVLAGLLFVLSRGRKNRFIAASVCLLLSVAVSLFSGVYAGSGFWTYTFPVLLMFISAVGAVWNIVPAALSKIIRAPILNSLAAVLLLLGIVLSAVSSINNNTAAADRRDRTVLSAVVDAGGLVFNAKEAKLESDAAIAEFRDALTEFDAAMEKVKALEEAGEIDSFPSYEFLYYYITELPEADVTSAERKAYAAATLLDSRITTLSTVIAELPEGLSAEALDAFEKSSAGIEVDLSEDEETEVNTGGDTASSAVAPAPSAELPSIPNGEKPDFEALEPIEAAEAAIEWGELTAHRAIRAAENAESSASDAYDMFNTQTEKIENAVTVADAAIVKWHTLVLSLLPAACLILLNLSFSSYEVKQYGATAAFARLCGRIFGWFYRDVGGKLQKLAKVQAGVCMGIACVSAFAAAFGLCGFLANYFLTQPWQTYAVILGYGVAGIISSFILALPTWLLYAFGQLTSDVREVKENTALTAAPYEEENPDDLPEL